MVKALGQLYSKLLQRPVDPNNQILVTVGAYEALYDSFLAWVNPGDEVIIIEPFFDCYKPMVELAGGKPVFIPLRPPANASGVISSGDWKLDMTELESKFSNKTKMIVVNTPHNPLGKVCFIDYILSPWLKFHLFRIDFCKLLFPFIFFIALSFIV